MLTLSLRSVGCRRFFKYGLSIMNVLANVLSLPTYYCTTIIIHTVIPLAVL